MSTRLLARTAALASLGLALAACSVTVDGPDSGGSSVTGSDGGSTVVAEGTWLYEIPSDANADSGAKVSVVIAGGDGTEHGDSTSQWLGCDGTPAVTSYSLDGGYEVLYGTLAFREGTPEGLLAVVQIETEQGVLGQWQVDSDGGAPLQLLVQDAATLTVTAEVSEGECGSADVGYLAFVDTYLTS